MFFLLKSVTSSLSDFKKGEAKRKSYESFETYFALIGLSLFVSLIFRDNSSRWLVEAALFTEQMAKIFFDVAGYMIDFIQPLFPFVYSFHILGL
jgi:hypothetical protein